MNLFPPSTNTDYAGARISVLWLFVMGVLTIGPGLAHSFLPDGGAGVIAHLDMGDRREMVIAAFRWEGATQLALGPIFLLAAIRYQSLTPFLILMGMVERGLMALEGWVIRPPSTGQHPPEHYASVVAAALSAVFLLMSLRRRRP